MVWNSEGFLIPRVDTTACVKCGLCVKKCIAQEENEAYTDDISAVKAFGGWNKDAEVHIASSSGGVFSALAEHVIKLGGVVFGVVWKDKLTAAFSKAKSREQLISMRGSKYTPALPEYVYRDVQKELKRSRQVLFSGTPCQVHALRKFLRKDYENLLTIDIVCHGMPSHLLLEKYVAEKEEKTGKQIHHVSFRDKPEGWLNFHVSCYFEDDSKESESLQKDMYMRLFLSDKILNKVCYNCPYAHFPRQGDITLGDYWGAQLIHNEWPIEKGISAVLTNTLKGEERLLNIGKYAELHEKPVDDVYRFQASVYIKPKNDIPGTRAHVLKKITSVPLRELFTIFVETWGIGPLRISRKSLLYRGARKVINKMRRGVVKVNTLLRIK